MKALELKVYERDEYGDYVDTVAPDGRQYLIALEDVEVYCMDKRLSDAELAAEMHAANSDAWRAHIARGPALGRLEDHFQTLHRFATLPHYDAPTETGTQA